MAGFQKIGIASVILYLLTLSLFYGCDLYSDEGLTFNGIVEGVVYDRSTNLPIPNAEILYERKIGTYSDYYYYNYYNPEYYSSTFADKNGAFNIRNLLEEQEYILAARKWPGYDEQSITLFPEGRTTQNVNFYLDSANAEFTVDPLSLHFETGQDAKDLVLTNTGNKPFPWEIRIGAAWIECWPKAGTLNRNVSVDLHLTVDRGLIEDGITESYIVITILPTGEEQIVDITVDL